MKNLDKNNKYVTLDLEDLINENEKENVFSQFVIINIKKNTDGRKTFYSSSSSIKDFFEQNRKKKSNEITKNINFDSKNSSILNNDDESELLNIPIFNENYLRNLFNVEKDEIRKHYIYKQLLRLSFLNKNEACFFFLINILLVNFKNQENMLKHFLNI